MAAILLSDTSGSDEDEESDEQENGVILADEGEVIDNIYKMIKIETTKLKKSGNNDGFVQNWIKTQEKSYRNWMDKRNSSLPASSINRVDDEKGATKLKHVIPEVTKIKPTVKLSNKQIKQEMSKIDREERERWYHEFVRRETKTAPMLKSDLKKNMDLITQGNFEDVLSSRYNKQLTELKNNIGDFVLRLERVMGELETKDMHPKTSANGQGETAQANSCNEESIENDRTESNDVSSASEDEMHDLEQQWDDIEEILSKNIEICPNPQKIKQLLETKILYPDSEKDVVKLGKSLAQVEKELLDSKGLEQYQTRIVYFYFYKSNLSPESVTAVYESMAAESVENQESEVGQTRKGCSVVYENVNLCIVMVEGTEFDIIDHLNKVKQTVIFPAIKKGKVLYVHRNLTKLYFSKWVTRVESPPVRKVTYLTKSKKILYRTAASRLVRMSEMLHKLYRHISKEERYIVDPKSIYIKSKYLILLPSPAMFSYLQKYDILRDLRTYLLDLGKPLELESDDELLFAFVEDKMFSYYIDSDEDEEVMAAKLNYVKTIISATDDGHGEKIKEMSHLRMKDDGKLLSWDDYQLDEISTTIIDRRVRLCEEPDHPACRLSSAIERRQSRDYAPKKGGMGPVDKNEQEGEYRLLTFLEEGSDEWPQNAYGLEEFQKSILERGAEGLKNGSDNNGSEEKSNGEESSECDMEGRDGYLTEEDLGSISSLSTDETP